jgi:hypothetical protein
MSNEVEQEARNLGWVPQEEFKGDLAKWVSAETFVERGHTVMPILRKNNEKLESMVRQQQTEIERMKNLYSASQESIQELQKVHAEATKKAVADARKEVMVQLRAAKESGDIDSEMQLTEQLAEIKAAENDLKNVQATPPAASPTPQSSQTGAEAVHPDFAGWQSENKWFGTDERKTLRAMGIAQELRADPTNDNLQGRAFFDKINEVIEERTSGVFRSSKVGESRPSGSPMSGSGRGRSYADLPADAKSACDRQGTKLVGEGRAFKDISAWRTYYTNLYYQGETA